MRGAGRTNTLVARIMRASYTRAMEINAPPSFLHLKLAATLRSLWTVARVSLLSVLLLIAPVVEWVCGALLLLGLLVSIAFKISGAGAGFPFWSMIAASLGFGIFVIFYHA